MTDEQVTDRQERMKLSAGRHPGIPHPHPTVTPWRAAE